MRILFIQYDNGDFLPYFPCNISSLIAYLRDKVSIDLEILVYSQDILHTSDEAIRQYIENIEPDMVCLGSVAGYYPHNKLKSISMQINLCDNRGDFDFIIGGYMVTPEPEYFLNLYQADIAVLGEGEETLRELVLDKELKDIKGIAYRLKDTIFINETRELLDLKEQPLPAYHDFNLSVYKLCRYPNIKNNQFCVPVFSGRGCPYKCTFCYRMYPNLRLYPLDYIEENIKYLKSNYGITYFMFYDELTMCSTARVMSICDMIDGLGFKINWACNGRLNIVNKEILKRMKDTGCVFINYGIESMDNKVLENMKKKLTVEQVKKGIEATLEQDISPGFNIIFGNKGDTKESLMKGVDFLLRYDDGSQRRTIRPVTPYPGCELYYDAIMEGKLTGVKDFYEKHVNSEFLSVNYTELSDDEFHECLREANQILLSNYYNKQKTRIRQQVDDLYINKNKAFRGFR